MTSLHAHLIFSLLGAVALVACSQDPEPPTADATTSSDATIAPSTVIGHGVWKAMEKARAELASENISLNNINISHKADGSSSGTRVDASVDARPQAEITPQGELLIDGRKVNANAQQQALLKTYRNQVEGIASAGMDIGVTAADIGMKAAGEAISSVFNGNTNQLEARVERQVKEQIESSVIKLCDLLPPLLETQTQLAAQMPQFQPYASMDQSDVDGCYKDIRSKVAHTHSTTR